MDFIRLLIDVGVIKNFMLVESTYLKGRKLKVAACISLLSVLKGGAAILKHMIASP
jgi:hypothetical protein